MSVDPKDWSASYDAFMAAAGDGIVIEEEEEEGEDWFAATPTSPVADIFEAIITADAMPAHAGPVPADELTPEKIAAAAIARANLAADTWEKEQRPLTPDEQEQVDAIAAAERERLGRSTSAAGSAHDEHRRHVPDPHPNPEPEPDEAAGGLIVGIDTYRASVPATIPWVVVHLAYTGGVSLIVGPPKGGKSTLAAQIQRCRETGERLFGTWDVTTGPTLLVTEEGGVAVIYKTEGLHALDVLDRRSAVQAGLTFAQVLEEVSAWGAANPAGLAFIDTLAIWAGIVDENDASETTRAIAAVTAVAQAAVLAIVLVHHSRKGGGDDGEAVRGSGAILAAVDIAIELSRVSPGSDERRLDIMGRVGLAERYELEFDRATMSYTLGDQADSRLAVIEADLVGVPIDGPGMTRNGLHALWKRDPRKRAEELVNIGRMRSEYIKGERAFAWRYWAIPAAWTPEDRRED